MISCTVIVIFHSICFSGPIPMLVHYRHRRGVYPLTPRPRSPVRVIVAGILILFFVYAFGSKVLTMFGMGGAINRLPAIVSVEDRGTVTVTLEGEEPKRAENAMKLFPGEKISTGQSGDASLTLFDGTILRLDQQTDVELVESTRSEEGAELLIELTRGSAWISVPASFVSSGSIVRTIDTPTLSFDFPPKTEAVVSPSSLLVFSAKGQGIEVTQEDRNSVFIGEGQRLQLPSDPKTTEEDLYAYRTPLDPSIANSTFVESSRKLWKSTSASLASTQQTAPSGNGLLNVQSPQTGAKIAQTVEVRGSYGANVVSVTVNGYPAELDKEKLTFSQEVAPPAGTTSFEIRVIALDASGNPLAEERRQVTVEAQGTTVGVIDAPGISSPAAAGETYRSQQEEIVLRGTSPKNAVSIIVNNYKLQLFDPAKGTWSYLAGTRLGNLKPGINTYEIVAVDANDTKSKATTLTILLEEGAEGVVSGSSSSARLDPVKLPANAPLTPGVLKLTGPAADPAFIATGTGFILQGDTSTQTASIWINDYQLQLYKSGKNYWNYIASPDLKTLKPGKNTFSIIARNANGEILDKLEYTVTYER